MARRVAHKTRIIDGTGKVYFVRCGGCRWWVRKESYSKAMLAGMNHEAQGVLFDVRDM